MVRIINRHACQNARGIYLYSRRASCCFESVYQDLSACALVVNGADIERAARRRQSRRACLYNGRGRAAIAECDLIAVNEAALKQVDAVAEDRRIESYKRGAVGADAYACEWRGQRAERAARVGHRPGAREVEARASGRG